MLKEIHAKRNTERKLNSFLSSLKYEHQEKRIFPYLCWISVATFINYKIQFDEKRQKS